MSEFYEFELPNGFTYNRIVGSEPKRITHGVMRGVGTTDMSYLRDTRNMRKCLDAGWTPVDEIVKRNIVDFGGEKDPTVIKDMYENYLHLADSLYLLVETRRHGVSDRYAFDAKCPECEAPVRPQFKLSGLEVEEPPEEHRGKDEWVLPVVDPYGEALPMVITFGPLLAKHGVDLRSIKDDHADARAEMEAALQVKKINDKPVTQAEIKKLTYREYIAISYTMEQVCGGFNFKLDYLHSARHCKKEVVIPVQINLRDFLLPGKGSGQTTGEGNPCRSNGTGRPCSVLGDRGFASKTSVTAS